MITLRSLSEHRGMSLEGAEVTELTRILTVDPEVFRRRQREKAQAGL
jgi:putative ubiquitin-RnfH superfamily antitoxin RatB of RatAB toxin-antitoxin module